MSVEPQFPASVPSPRGPYAPAVRAGDFLFVSGQGPIDPATDKLSLGDIQHETRLVLGNLKRILEGCGASLNDVVRCGVFLKNGDDFKAMNEVYAEMFGSHKPARTTVVTGFHVSEMKVEIDCVAYKPVAPPK
jgi:2-iminobutanoate/2-iminopropanoate deaminase